MREDFPERPEMEDMRQLVELYARGLLSPDILTRETRRYAFVSNVVEPVRRWVAARRGRRMLAEDDAAASDIDIPLHRTAR